MNHLNRKDQLLWALIGCVLLILTIYVLTFLYETRTSPSVVDCQTVPLHADVVRFNVKVEKDPPACGSRLWDRHPRCVNQLWYITELGTEARLESADRWISAINWDKVTTLEKQGIRPLIFIRTGSHGKGQQNDVDTFFESNVMDRFRSPVDLVTSDGDRSYPTEHLPSDLAERWKRHPRRGTWWTQNLDVPATTHSFIRPIPIGFDMHSKPGCSRQDVWNLLSTVQLKPLNDRNPRKVLCEAHLSVTHGERQRMYQLWHRAPWLEALQERCSFSDLCTNYYSQFAFVVSPRGNGLDCHRTWEALWCGAIVITVRVGGLESLYKHLPVVVLEDWSDLQTDERGYEQLHQWKQRFESMNIQSVRRRICSLFPME